MLQKKKNKIRTPMLGKYEFFFFSSSLFDKCKYEHLFIERARVRRTYSWQIMQLGINNNNKKKNVVISIYPLNHDLNDSLCVLQKKKTFFSFGKHISTPSPTHIWRNFEWKFSNCDKHWTINEWKKNNNKRITFFTELDLRHDFTANNVQ